MTRKQSKQKAKEKAQAEDETGAALDSPEDVASSVASESVGRSPEASKASTHSLVICLKSNIDSDRVQGAFSVVHAGVHPLNKLKSVFNAQTSNAAASEYVSAPRTTPGVGIAAIVVVSPQRLVFMTYLTFDVNAEEGLPDPIPFAETHFKRTWSRLLLTYNWARKDRLKLNRVIGGKGKTSFCHACYGHFPKSQLKYCSRCRIYRYCSEDCLHKDYEAHKELCKLKAGQNTRFDVLALQKRNVVADRLAYAEFIKRLSPDVAQACYAAFKLLDQPPESARNCPSTSIMFITTNTATSDDASLAYIIRSARIIDLQDVPNTLRTTLTARNIANTEAVIDEVANVLNVRIRDGPERLIERGARVTRAAFALFVNLDTSLVRSEGYCPLIFPFAKNPKLLLRVCGARNSSDDWEERLKQRSRTSAEEPQPGANPPMSKREWARWSEKL